MAEENTPDKEPTGAISRKNVDEFNGNSVRRIKTGADSVVVPDKLAEEHWTMEQRDFFASLGADGINRLGEIVFAYIPLVQAGDMGEIRRFRSEKGRVEEDLGKRAQLYLNARLDEIERQYGQISPKDLSR